MPEPYGMKEQRAASNIRQRAPTPLPVGGREGTALNDAPSVYRCRCRTVRIPPRPSSERACQCCAMTPDDLLVSVASVRSPQHEDRNECRGDDDPEKPATQALRWHNGKHGSRGYAVREQHAGMVTRLGQRSEMTPEAMPHVRRKPLS